MAKLFNKAKENKEKTAPAAEVPVSEAVEAPASDVTEASAPEASSASEVPASEAQTTPEAPAEEAPVATATAGMMLSDDDDAGKAKKSPITEFLDKLTAKYKAQLEEKKKAKDREEHTLRIKSRQNLMLSIKNLTIGRENITTTVIAIDPDRTAFHFYSMLGNDKETLTHHVRHYAAGTLFGENFFKRFKYALKEYANAHPVDGIRKVTLIVPDVAVVTDTIKMPTMRGIGKTGRNLPYAINALYKNPKELRVISHVAHKNRRHTTYSIAAIQRSIMTSLYAACSENGMLVDAMTFASASRVAAISNLHPKQKNASYLFLDMKESASTYTFVAHGKATGFYSVPFGTDFLYQNKPVSEDMLFNHSFAELAVLNAKEKAKAKKQLTVMSADETVEDEEELMEGFEETASAMEDITETPVTVSAPVEEDDFDEEPEEGGFEEEGVIAQPAAEEPAEVTAAANAPRVPTPKIFTRKAARRLPKFMQRPTPLTKEDILAENFRIFVKWALTLIASNEKLTELGAPEYVLVNLPAELASVIEYANREKDENGIDFKGMLYTEEDAKIAANLALYGGFSTKQMKTGKF